MDILLIVLRFLGQAFLITCVVIASLHIDKYFRDRRQRKRRRKLFRQMSEELDRQAELLDRGQLRDVTPQRAALLRSRIRSRQKPAEGDGEPWL